MKVLIQKITFTNKCQVKFNIMQPTSVVFLPMLNLPTLYSRPTISNYDRTIIDSFQRHIKSSKFGKGQATAV